MECEEWGKGGRSGRLPGAQLAHLGEYRCSSAQGAGLRCKMQFCWAT